MELHQLHYFVALARTGNFSRAAEQCHVSQPSLSQQIQKLEDELGEPLFVRRGRVSRLTRSGEELLPRAMRILDELESARREILETHSCERGTLTIGVLPTIAPYLLPPVLAAFRAKHPGVAVLIEEDTTARLLELAAGFALDLAIVSTPLREERVEVMELFAEPLLLAVPARHRLAKKPRLALADLEHEQLIVMKEGHCLGDQVLGFCEGREVRTNISFRSAQLETVRELVRAGLGVSLVPEMAARDGAAKGVVYRALPRPGPSRKIVAVWPKTRAPRGAAAIFLSLLQEAPFPKTTPAPRG
jgi:LysR family hydrogen peroxide-inducible transcriptional activator